MNEMHIEAPEDDAIELQQPAGDPGDLDPDDWPDSREIPLDADEADAAEQHRVVELDDDYRL